MSERCLVVDARCLQDPDYAERGVGRHTVNLLRHAPRHAASRLIGLIDPVMPALSATFGSLFDTLCPNALARPVRDPACFVSPSPMTHDPLFIARLLDQHRAFKAAVIYDFIPHDIPDRYLVDKSFRHAYFTRMRWLSRYDMFMPISEASAARLHDLLGVARDRIVVAGAALDGAFDGQIASAVAARHVLVIGGGDPRKNVECAVRSHAMAGLVQAAGIPLVITGQYGPAQISEFRALAVESGGDGQLLEMPGHVPEVALLELYQQAVCVVAPSRAEGFDLPVIEAMACGAPVLASDIPAHRELVRNAEWRFDPDDYSRLAGLIERMYGNRPARELLVEEQATVWPHYRAVRVAERFWRPIEERLASEPAAPSIGCGRRPRVALLSPLPPDRSGVADYTAATCAELGKLTELHVFSPTERPAVVPGAAAVCPLSALPSLSVRYDSVINVMGNSEFHRRIFNQLLRYGGACIAHDSRMLGFYRISLGMDRARSVAEKELRRPVASSEVDGWIADEASLEVLHYGEIAAAADPVIVHSRGTAELMQARYDVAPVLLPFSIYRPWHASNTEQRAAARERLRLRESEVAIASFGFVHRTKAPEECLWALKILRDWGIDASLHFVGAHAETNELDRLVSELGLTDAVVFLGSYVHDETYRDYLIAADLGIQLRMTYLGSPVGRVARLHRLRASHRDECEPGRRDGDSGLRAKRAGCPQPSADRGGACGSP